MVESEGRVALVVGGSRGIGAGIAERLAADGVAVVVNSRKVDDLAAVVERIEEAGGAALAVPGSITDENVCGELVSAAVRRFGRIDHIVNAVGVNYAYGPLMEVGHGPFVATMERNTWPSVALLQEALRQGFGRFPEGSASVVLVSTIGSHTVAPFLAAYSASKSALDTLTRQLGRELGPRGIRVNAIAPGLVVTEMSRSLWEGDKAEREAALLPLGRLGRPVDIASAAAWLLSEESSWVTGQVLDVDGGRLLVGDEPADLIGADLSSIPSH